MYSQKNNTVDNRNYDYTLVGNEVRPDYDPVVDLIPPKSQIVDLGCGNGALMQRLIKEKNVTATGIELSESAVDICKKNSLNVIHGRIDEQLPFSDNEFEYSICHITIQMVMYPEVLLKEMKRISKYQVISFPNFAFYKNRFDMLFNGRMPVPMLFNHKWYTTGHIHQLSVNDFNQLMNEVGGLHIEKFVNEKSGSQLKDYLIKKFPNLFQVLIIYLLSKK